MLVAKVNSFLATVARKQALFNGSTLENIQVIWTILPAYCTHRLDYKNISKRELLSLM